MFYKQIMRTSSDQSNSRRKDVELAGGSGQLCARCATIDIEPLLDPQLKVPTDGGLHIVPLGKPRSKDFQKFCPLCELFLSVATRYKKRYSLELRLFNRVPEHYLSNCDTDVGADQRFLAVIRQNKQLRYDYSVAHEIGSSGLLLPISSTFYHMCSVHIVDPSFIRYASLTDWLQNCAVSHGNSCNQGNPKSSSIQIYALDCLNNTVVPLSQNEKYVALSYVWGTMADAARFSTSATENDKVIASQPSDIPLTIRDAIQVVQNIGHRYLWVDRYCIPQTEISQKRQVILNMNQVYAGAEVTIVALYGHTIHAGLPGVSMIPRSGRQQCLTQRGPIISTLPPLATVIGESTWSTRGWTYQEARLSRRCLFFTKYQVYFSCHAITLSEALSDGPSTSLVARNLNSRGLEPLTFSPSRNMSGLFLDRLAYSQRTLSYQQDALDAFRGILRLHPFVTLWGIPVTLVGWRLDPDIGFAMGLLWIRRPSWSFDRHMTNKVGSSYARRPGFPTWSWTSVVGEIFQDSYGEQSFYGKFFSQVSHFPDFQMGGLVSSLKVEMPISGVSLDEAIEFSETNILPEKSISIFLEGEIITVMQRKTDESFWFCQKDNEPILDHVIYAYPDIDGVEKEDSDSKGREFELRDALILIEWNDDQRSSETRFVLMLLQWVADGIAERVGLLGEYRKSWDIRFVKSLPRKRKKFELK